MPFIPVFHYPAATEREEGIDMLFICYAKCSTCKKAKEWLDEREIKYETRDIKADNPSETEITAWKEASGLPLKRFFNTSGNSYRELNLKDKLPGMTEEDMSKLLSTDGMLVKRPLLIGDGFVLVGFRELEWSEKLE